jgi:starch-binding outer membrane protein, SusD/RagB family
MNKICYNILTLSLFILSGCGDILDLENPSHISPAIWNDEQAASLYLNRLYERSLPGAGFGAEAGNSDEAPGSSNVIYGQLTANDQGTYSQAYYNRIREINIGLDQLEESTLPEEAVSRLRGQMLFLRAWEYWGLVILYGGVPIITHPQNPFEEDPHVPRNNARECFEILFRDLSEAQDRLPASWPENERGRVTRGAAAALKGRLHLFWASPQFNPQNDINRWLAAYEANREAKELLIQDGYGLHDNFLRIFLDKGNREVVFARLFSFAANRTHGWENGIRPREIGATGGGTSNPTLAMVNAFPMQNGKNIKEEDSGFDPNAYFKNRDPRFYATIVYNGAPYPVTGKSSDRKQWTYYYQNDGNLTSVENVAPTGTGFYCRKGADPDISRDRVNQTETDWVEIRYAEVLLNLAEAANEAGYPNEAYTELFAIRERAGIAAGDGNYGLKEGMSGEELTEAIMQERQIELAYEGKRYWDLRRRNWFEEKLNGTRRYGLRTILREEVDPNQFASKRNEIDLEEDFALYFRVEEWLLDEQFEINYPQPLYNFFGIPQNIRDRSPAVVQTIGWENGTFDPLVD